MSPYSPLLYTMLWDTTKAAKRRHLEIIHRMLEATHSFGKLWSLNKRVVLELGENPDSHP